MKLCKVLKTSFLIKEIDGDYLLDLIINTNNYIY